MTFKTSGRPGGAGCARQRQHQSPLRLPSSSPVQRPESPSRSEELRGEGGRRSCRAGGRRLTTARGEGSWRPSSPPGRLCNHHGRPRPPAFFKLLQQLQFAALRTQPDPGRPAQSPKRRLRPPARQGRRTLLRYPRRPADPARAAAASLRLPALTFSSLALLFASLLVKS